MNKYQPILEAFTTHDSNLISCGELIDFIYQLRVLLDQASIHIDPDDSKTVYLLCMLADYSDLLLESAANLKLLESTLKPAKRA
jgi:hypothetical protein